MLIRYVRRLVNRLGRRSVKVLAKGTAPRLLPRFEVLEDRTLLDAVHWLNPVSGNWNTASNWENSHIPVIGDTAIIDATGPNYTVTLDINATVDGFTLNSANASFTTSIFSRTFTVNGPATLSAGTVFWVSSTWAGTGTLTNGAAGTLVVEGSCTLSAPFSNAAGATLRVLTTRPFPVCVLTVAQGFSNAGAIELENGHQVAALTVSAGVLTNTGTISALAGVCGLTAQLDNQGTLTVPQSLHLNLRGASSNSGTINASGDLSLFSASDGATLDNIGTIAIASGRMLRDTTVPLAATTFTGGTLISGTYNLTGTFQFPNAAIAAITTNAATIVLNGPNSRIINPSGGNALANFATNNGTFTILNGRNFTTAGNWSNSGSLTVGAESTLTVNGTFTQTPSGSLTVQLGGTAPGQFSQVVVTSLAMLDGTLNVTEVGAFTPAAGDTFQVMSFGSRSNDFATKTGFQLGGGLFLREDLTSGVTLQAFQAQLLFQQQPSDTNAGQLITPAVRVAIVDPSTGIPIAFDNSDMVTLSLNGCGTLMGTLTQMVNGGVATFGDLSINQAGAGYTLNANSTGLSQITSAVFAINPAAADHLLFVQQPTDTTAGQPIIPAVTVEILDQFNNVLTNDNSDTITLSLNGVGTLNGTLTQMVSSGVATFGDLSINQAGTGYMLNANSTGIAQITSNAFAITAAAADHLLFLQQPTDTAAGQTISPVVVQVVDQFGNVVTNYSGAVTLSLNDNPMTGATLRGTLTVTVVNGLATFSDLSIDLAGTGYTLHAAIGGGLPDIDSDPFNIT
jgi:hypothetical protein